MDRISENIAVEEENVEISKNADVENTPEPTPELPDLGDALSALQSSLTGFESAVATLDSRIAALENFSRNIPDFSVKTEIAPDKYANIKNIFKY
jgi:hypothetical protein